MWVKSIHRQTGLCAGKIGEKMNVNKWINKNRKAIDKYTQSNYKNDDERRLWVLNDEYLYHYCKYNRELFS